MGAFAASFSNLQRFTLSGKPAAGERLRAVAEGRLVAGMGRVDLVDIGVSFVPQNRSAVVENVRLNIAPGEFVALLGPSGCGKTTLLNVIGGILMPTVGEVRIDGIPVAAPTPDCNVVFQQHSLFPWMTVIDNVAFGPQALGHTDPRNEALRFLRMVGLEEYADVYPSALSGGMQQRVAIARALITAPKVLLMDEPFGALDAQTRSIMQEELLKLRQQFSPTVVFVTHDVDEALLLADRIFVMRVRPGGIREEIRMDATLRDSDDILQNPEFRALRKHILNLIREETLKTFRQEGSQ
jgi:NitT/TauT family transport system ATP-binding protein